jgi:hypothetical protein
MARPIGLMPASKCFRRKVHVDEVLAWHQMPQRRHICARTSAVLVCCCNFLGLFRWRKSLGKVPVALFVVIWQNLSNHRLTRLKRFVSAFTDKLCNKLFFYLHLMLHACV